MHAEWGGPGDLFHADLVCDPAPDGRGDRVDRRVTRQPFGLALVQIPDEGEPAPLRQRREHHVALPAGDQRRPVPGQPAGRAHIGDQRGTRVGRARQCLGHRLPCHAVGTASADDPGGLGGLERPVRSLEPDVHTVIPLLNRHRRDAALHAAAKLGEPVGEDSLGAPLGQTALEIPRASRACESHLGHETEIRVEDSREPQMDRRRERPIHHPSPRENLERTRLQRSGASLAMRFGLALDHAGPHTVPRELKSGKQARRSRADYQHLGLRRLAHRPR